MGKSVHYNITFGLLFFIMILHIYFVIFFTENKIRLTFKFHSFEWKNLIGRDFFNGILYIEYKSQNEKCSKNYMELSDYIWPGVSEGVFLEEYSINDTCKILSTKTITDPRYKLKSIFSTTIGNLNIFKEYLIDTPFEKDCIGEYTIKGNTCTCHNKIIDTEDFFFNYPDKKITCGKSQQSRRVCFINSIKPISLLTTKVSDKYKKICAYKEYNFYPLFNNNKVCKKGYIKCFNEFCVENNTNTKGKCPDYSNLNRNKNVTFTKPISSLDISYNGIKCSKLNNKTIKEEILLSEANIQLSKFNQSDYTENDIPLCIYNDSEKYEDILVLFSSHSIEYYSKIGLENSLKKIFDNETEQDKVKYKEQSFYEKLKKIDDKIYLVGTTNFDINKNTICSETVFQDLAKAFKSAENIELINVGKIFFFELAIILGYCYILYKYFMMRGLKIQNEDKFYYVKYFLFWSVLFLIVNFIPYYLNYTYKLQVQQSIIVLDEVTDKKCFENDNFIEQTNIIKTKLKNFSILNYEIYGTILKETTFVIIVILLIIYQIMSFKTFFFELYSETKKRRKKKENSNKASKVSVDLVKNLKKDLYTNTSEDISNSAKKGINNLLIEGFKMAMKNEQM